MTQIDPEVFADNLGWIQDVPLFIDEDRVERLYDITARPLYYENREELKEAEESESRQETSERSASASFGFGDMVPGISLKSAIEGRSSETDEQSSQQRFAATQLPQRQLAQIAIQYLQPKIDERTDGSEDNDMSVMGEMKIVNRPSDLDDEIGENQRDINSGRDLFVLILPGLSEIHGADDESADFEVETTLVPTAAEFSDGSVVPIYGELETDREKPPRYPQRSLTWAELGDYYSSVRKECSADSGDEVSDNVDKARESYWEWFEDNFDPKAATRKLEEVAAEHGDIRWIDFRLPYTSDGKTLHLHLQGREDYHTGTFAYNFIKRGRKHGLVLIGTVKSEPDMDVLAIYER